MPRYLPHDVFRLILSFKDPRYERVRSGGDPFGKTPTRVWYTKREYRGRMDGVTRTPAIIYYGRTATSIVPSIEICVHKRYFTWWHADSVNTFRVSNGIWTLGRTLHPTFYTSDDDNFPCAPLPVALSLQCEACGPDLELYQMLRR